MTAQSAAGPGLDSIALSLTQSADGGPLRTFDYLDYQYFLSQGNGPWGTRSWSYDKIGNRITEAKAGEPTQTYAYFSPGHKDLSRVPWKMKTA